MSRTEPGQQEGLLEHEHAPFLGHGDRPVIDGDQAGDEMQQRGLSRSGRADDRDGSSTGGYRRVDTVEHVTAPVVVVRDAAQLDAISGVAPQGDRRVGDHRLVEQFADAIPAGDRVRQLRQGEPDQTQREHQEGEQVDEAGQLADRHRAAANAIGAADEQEDVDDVGNTVEQRLERAAQADRPEAGVAQSRGDDGETIGLAALRAERLDDGDSVEALVHRFAELAELALRCVVERVDTSLIREVQTDQHREHGDRGETQPQVGDQQPHRREHQHQHHAGGEGQWIEHLGGGLGIDTGASDDVARAVQRCHGTGWARLDRRLRLSTTR